MRGVRAGFFLVYIPSFGEFAIPELMGGDKQMFVGSVVSQLHSRRRNRISRSCIHSCELRFSSSYRSDFVLVDRLRLSQTKQ